MNYQPLKDTIINYLSQVTGLKTNEIDLPEEIKQNIEDLFYSIDENYSESIEAWVEEQKDLEGTGVTNIERGYYVAGKFNIPFDKVPEFIADLNNALGIETKTLP